MHTIWKQELIFILKIGICVINKIIQLHNKVFLRNIIRLNRNKWYLLFQYWIQKQRYFNFMGCIRMCALCVYKERLCEKGACWCVTSNKTFRPFEAESRVAQDSSQTIGIWQTKFRFNPTFSQLPVNGFQCVSASSELISYHENIWQHYLTSRKLVCINYCFRFDFKRFQFILQLRFI